MGKGTVIFGVVGGTLALGIVAAGIGWLQRDAILESMLERNLTEVSGVEAQIKDVDSKFFEGQFTIEQLTLNNPEGFKTPHLLAVERLDVQLDPDTLWQDTVKIKSIAVEGVTIKIEQTLSRNNVSSIVDQLQESGGSRNDNGSGSGQGKQVEIERLTISDIDAQLKVSAIAGLGLTQTIEISDIEVSNLDTYNAEGKLLEALSGAVTSAIFGELGKSTNPGRLISP